MFVVITPEFFAHNEAELLTEFVTYRNVFVHIRKPNAAESEMKNYLKGLSTAVLKRSSLHSFHHLANQFNVRGVHYTTRQRETLGKKLKTDVAKWKSQGKKVSASLHNLTEVSTLWDYAFLSPVFDSISKSYYSGKQFSVTEKEEQIIALGGITTSTIQTAHQLGYQGVAVLGSIWKDDYPLKAFKDLHHQYSQYFQ